MEHAPGILPDQFSISAPLGGLSQAYLSQALWLQPLHGAYMLAKKFPVGAEPSQCTCQLAILPAKQ